MSVVMPQNSRGRFFWIFFIIALFLPLDFVTPAEDFNISIYTIIVGIILLLMSSLLIADFYRSETAVIIKNNTVLILILFFIVSIITLPFSNNPPISVSWVFRLGYYTVVTILIAIFISSRWNNKMLISLSWVFVICSTFISVTIITDYLSITSFGTLPGNQWEDPSRAAGIVAEPNFAAALLAILSPFYVPVYNQSDTTSRKAVIIILAICLISGIYLTGSRAGVLLILISAVFLLFANKDKFLKIKNIVTSIISVGLVIIVLSVLNPVTLNRLKRLLSFATGGRGDGSLNSRAEFIRIGIDIFQQHPLTGIGPGNYINYTTLYGYPRPKDAHNTYIEILTGVGIFGFLLFVLLLITVLLRFIRLHYNSNNDIVIYYISSYAVFLFSIGSLSNTFNVMLWFVFIPLAVAIETSSKYERS